MYRDADREATLALVLACAAGFAFSANYTNHAPLVPMLQAQFTFSKTLAGLLTSGIFLTHALMQVPGGHLADRFGGKRVLLAALALVAVGNAGLALSTSYAQLLAWKVIVGFGTGTSFVAGARYLTAFTPHARLARAQGFYGASILAGSGFVIFAIPRIAAQLGWAGAFWSTVSVAVLAFIAWFALASAPRAVVHPPSHLLEMLAHGQLWLLGLVQMASFGLVIVVGAWVTLLLTTNLALAPRTAGALGSLVLLLGILSRPLGGRLVGQIGVRTLLTVSLLLNAAACFAMAMAPRSFAIAIGAIVVLGIGCGLPYAALFTRAAALFPGRAGAAMGLVNMLGIVMILVGAPLVGRLADATQTYTSSFVALGVFSLVILLTSQFIHHDARL
jgi:NNP family nitrate/nitrite transporter-like MFS transporter